MSFATGVIGALLLPTLSIFFADAIGVSPFWVGIPYAGIAIGSIVYNQLIGAWSDKLADRRWLVVGLCFVGLVACAIFALSRDYWITCLCAIGLLSLSMVAFSQVLAYSLEYAETVIPTDKVALFNALVRAQIAFAWVAGPPLGFLLVSYFSFAVLYWSAAGLFVLVSFFTLGLLPALADHRSANKAQVLPWRQVLTGSSGRSLIFCLLALSLMWGVNNAYLISLPLHLTRNLALDTQWVGWIMGTAAGLEVPVMLLAGVLAARVSPINIVRASGVAGLALYAGVYWADALWQLFVLQLANAVFIGILAGLGVSVVQQMLPGRAGSASALYTNTTHVGTLISSLLVSTVAEAYGYHSVFVANILLVLVATVMFFVVRDKRGESA
ncbi:sugar efflux transporter [Gilvimarinus xylanilyticus]|uniref:Sugar efflux transporter n=1 Tax=Gilvimarinus xylanilyticus TaxID=2944139 RepID=A0A9X2KW92_9GAMM|nr:sugar efflux transporter [Gilvimarinus xylanilyticus]MCP8898755.1 sugar efflux transporter [Gilvimarinus xylanilyticus]